MSTQQTFRWWLAVLAVSAGATALIHRPGLRSVPLADDFGQRAVMMHTFPAARGPLEAYTAIKADPHEIVDLIDRGVLPWWSNENMVASGLRPGASLLLALDYRLSLSSRGQHVHSLAWWVALLVTFAALARELLSPRVALLAVALFAVQPAHAVPLGWVANRAALVSATFSLLALLGHLRWRERASRPGLAASVAGTLAALLVSEYGLGLLGFLVALELWGPRGGRVRGAALVALWAVAYLAIRLLTHTGVRGTHIYSDPLFEPHEFVRQAAVRLPALLGQLALQLPSEHSLPFLRALPAGVRISVAALLVAAAAGLCGAVRRRAPALSWIALGTLLSSLPLLAVESAARLLVLPYAGGSLLVAALVARLVTRPMPSRVLAGLIVGVQGVCAALSAALASAALERTAARAADSVFASDVNPPDARARCFVILNTRDWISIHSAPFMLAAEHGGFPRCWFVLAASRGRVEVERPARDVIELSALDGTLLDVLSPAFAVRSLPLPSEAFLRSQPRLHVRVLQNSSAGPVHARFRMSFLLDAPEVTFVAWHGDRLRQTSLPGVGESRTIP